MKTRRNHRKTTTSRRRRRVVKQQRVQTRIHRRKGTAVSSRRRDYFFKRGGQSPPCEETNIDSDILNLVKHVKTSYEIPCTVECVHDITGLYNPTKDSTSLNITTSSNKNLIFRILEKQPGKQSVYIFNLNSSNEEVIYGRIIMVNGKENIVLYHPLVATEIFNALKTSKP